MKLSTAFKVEDKQQQSPQKVVGWSIKYANRQADWQSAKPFRIDWETVLLVVYPPLSLSLIHQALVFFFKRSASHNSVDRREFAVIVSVVGWMIYYHLPSRSILIEWVPGRVIFNFFVDVLPDLFPAFSHMRVDLISQAHAFFLGKRHLTSRFRSLKLVVFVFDIFQESIFDLRHDYLGSELTQDKIRGVWDRRTPQKHRIIVRSSRWED